MLSLIDYIHQCNYTIYLFKRPGRVFFSFGSSTISQSRSAITTKSANKCTGAFKTGTNILQASCKKTGHHFDSNVPRKKVYLRLSILFLFNYQIYIRPSVTHQRPTLIVNTNQSSNRVHWWHVHVYQWHGVWLFNFMKLQDYRLMLLVNTTTAYTSTVSLSLNSAVRGTLNWKP